MPSFITCNGRPKSIKLYPCRLPEELVAYLEETSPNGNKADRAKNLMETAIALEVAAKIGIYNLISLAKFFVDNPCNTCVVTVLPVSDPQARFLQRGGVCE